MKNTFKKAHEMTREMQAKYPEVDYQVQFGLFVSYLAAKEEEVVEYIKKEEVKSFENQMLTLTTSGRQPAWIAEITGADDKYKFSRSFINEPTVNGGRWVDYKLEEGVLYNWCESKVQQFGIVESGKLFEITKVDVENILANR